MMEFTKHSGATYNGLEIGCLEVDAGPSCATRVAERLAVEAEISLVDCEEQGLEFGKPFYQRVEVSNARDTGRQLANDLG